MVLDAACTPDVPLHTPHSECVSSSLPCDETAGSVDSFLPTTSGQCGHHGAAARDIGADMDSLQLRCVEAADGEMSVFLDYSGCYKYSDSKYSGSGWCKYDAPDSRKSRFHFIADSILVC
jgi:hypothetical protein